MGKNIMLHGATNWGSSNYGDYIYGEIIHDYLKDKGNKVCFYQPSPFFEKYITNYDKNSIFKKKDANMIVYIPGGYFGEGHSARFRDNVIQFVRFMPLGIWAAFKRIPLAIIGIGAGPNTNFLMNYGIRKICKHASLITVRDNESYKALKKLSPKVDVIECGDLILDSQLKETDVKISQISSIIDEAGNKKIALVHYNHEQIALQKFSKSMEKFSNKYSDYHVVVASDSILDLDDEYFEEFKKTYGKECSHFKYSNPKELTSMIKEANLVLTCKLHVGVVACSFGKSVIAAACHPEKTKRFYSQIGEEYRCINLYNSSDEELYSLIEKSFDRNVKISPDIKKKAGTSWQLLNDFIGEN